MIDVGFAVFSGYLTAIGSRIRADKVICDEMNVDLNLCET